MKHILPIAAFLLVGSASHSFAYDAGPCDPEDPSCPDSPLHDAGPQLDAGPPLDAGPQIQNDAGMIVDAGSNELDSGPSPDAGVQIGDAGPVTPMPSDDRGCSAGHGSSSAPGWLALSLLAFGLVRRR